jgi:hypothetical protein
LHWRGVGAKPVLKGVFMLKVLAVALLATFTFGCVTGGVSTAPAAVEKEDRWAKKENTCDIDSPTCGKSKKTYHTHRTPKKKSNKRED